MKDTTKHTPIPWIVREHPDNKSEFFVQGPRLKPEHPYDVEIMADDHGNELYPTEVKRADAEFIVRAVNSHDALAEALKGVDLILYHYLDEVHPLMAKVKDALKLAEVKS